MRRLRVTIALLSLSLPLLVAAAAQAAPTPEVEPNDNILQVTSTANTEGLAGTIGANGDVDYFWLGLRPQRQVKIVATAVSGCSSSSFWGDLVEMQISPADGSDDALATLSPSEDQPTKFMTTTTPGVFGGPTQYFLVKVSDDGTVDGCRYTLQVQSSTGGTTDAIDPNPPATYPVVPLAEPDDLPSQAYGPLVGETSYSGAIETSNDVDQVYFQVRAGAAVNLRLSVGAGQVYTESAESGGDDELDTDPYADAGEYSISTVAVASTDRTYRLAISGDAGSTYRLLLSPGTSLGVTPPPPPHFGRSVTIKRKKGAYTGRVTSADSRCVSSVVVTLRKKGRGAIGKTMTTASGTWRIKHKKKVKKVYATVARTARQGYSCGSDRSGVLKRGR